MVFFVGLGLLALWFLLVVLAFFLFFIPVMHWIFYLALDVGIASVILMGCGALIMLSGVSGWGWNGWSGEGARPGMIERRAARDSMKLSERFGEVIGLVISGLVLLFFVENQVLNTGFFTSAFGGTEQFLFYGAWVFGAIVTVIRATYGRRNAVRPLEVLQSIFWTISALWLLSVFPFNFTHLPDLLPSAIHFMFFWVNNQIGALVLLLAAIGGFASALYTSVLYVLVRLELKRGIPHEWGRPS